MIRKIFRQLSLILICLSLLPGCGGGSSGTALGPSDGDGRVKFSGIVISEGGEEVSFAQVTLLNTDDTVVADEAGAFELATDFPGGNAVLQVEPPGADPADVVVKDVSADPQTVELSIAYDRASSSAELLALTLRAAIVRNCSPLFLNARTIRQTAPIAEGVICTIEAEFKSDGLPVDHLLFELQRRGCSADDEWQFSDAGVTGSSGPGTGEINFTFRNDEKHCVYRIIGPLNMGSTQPLTAQVHTLRKIEFDEDNR